MIASSQAAGPAELLQLKSKHLMPCVYHFYKEPPQIVAGVGAKLFDHCERTYIDCLSGVGVMNAGHCESAIIEPAIEQIRTLQHTTTIYLTQPQLQLAAELARIAPAPLTRSFFCSSGSEAVEGALLLAMLHTKRRLIISFENSLHGRTRFAMSATGLPMWRTDPFPSSDVVQVPFGDTAALCDALEANDGKVAAVLGEPIQGNGGINVPQTEFWPEVRELCDAHGVLLVLDEVQTGFNRTGTWFACQHWGIAPDIMSMSKGLGNGFPIAAFMAGDSVAASYTSPGASTYGGNPVSAVAALATIAFHNERQLGRLAEITGQHFMSALDDVARRHPEMLRRPRGMGLMLGLPIRGVDGAQAAARCDALLEALKDRGVLAGKTGPGRNVLTFMPPLVIQRSECAQVIDALEDALPQTKATSHGSNPASSEGHRS